ncbi:hypothetical protein AAG570_007547 [Ranatra chinensis]|uniref:Transposase n=1 Tax=Ranatra chinensis TaxID=642074 RepID=A0ABD0Y969_9HEMI
MNSANAGSPTQTTNGNASPPLSGSCGGLDMGHHQGVIKVKRLLSTLVQYGHELAPETGDRVRSLVLSLVVTGSKIQHAEWLGYSTKDIARVMQTEKFPQTVMVFGCVSSEGDAVPPHFFQEGLRSTSDGYVELLNTVVKPRIRRVADGRPYVRQQDSASRHTSGKSQKWLSENVYDLTSPNVWPPNCPDLNPMDYFVWGAVEKDTPSNTKAQLMDKIKTVFADCSISLRFRSRIEAVIDANGGYFE